MVPTTTRVPPKPSLPEINPRFQEQLPEIIEEICAALSQAEPILESVKVRIQELHDYLDFEIKKAQLEVDKSEWETKLPPGQAEMAKEWLSKLKRLKDEFQADTTTVSIDFLNDLQKALENTFIRRNNVVPVWSSLQRE